MQVVHVETEQHVFVALHRESPRHKGTHAESFRSHVDDRFATEQLDRGHPRGDGVSTRVGERYVLRSDTKNALRVCLGDDPPNILPRRRMEGETLVAKLERRLSDSGANRNEVHRRTTDEARDEIVRG